MGPMPPIPPQQQAVYDARKLPIAFCNVYVRLAMKSLHLYFSYLPLANCDYDPPTYMDQNYDQNFGNPYDCPEGMYNGSMMSSVGYSQVS